MESFVCVGLLCVLRIRAWVDAGLARRGSMKVDDIQVYRIPHLRDFIRDLPSVQNSWCRTKISHLVCGHRGVICVTSRPLCSLFPLPFTVHVVMSAMLYYTGDPVAIHLGR